MMLTLSFTASASAVLMPGFEIMRTSSFAGAVTHFVAR
jgi:hypothetical protein